MHYNRFRYYDADVGRFVSHDPIGLAGGQNIYAYAPNPTGWVDPLGLYGVYMFKLLTASGTKNTYIGKAKGTGRYFDSIEERITQTRGTPDKGIYHDLTGKNPCPQLVSDSDFAFIVESRMMLMQKALTTNASIYLNEIDSPGTKKGITASIKCPTIMAAATKEASIAVSKFNIKPTGSGF